MVDGKPVQRLRLPYVFSLNGNSEDLTCLQIKENDGLITDITMRILQQIPPGRARLTFIDPIKLPTIRSSSPMPLRQCRNAVRSADAIASRN